MTDEKKKNTFSSEPITRKLNSAAARNPLPFENVYICAGGPRAQPKFMSVHLFASHRCRHTHISWPSHAKRVWPHISSDARARVYETAKYIIRNIARERRGGENCNRSTTTLFHIEGRARVFYAIITKRVVCVFIAHTHTQRQN